ncbi:hypothetical protein FQR65_LT18631 [Abscondita terminalis]|nr:hypothetical protein FQR65_LT18631 [Abscondita terminalis]
MYAFDYEDIQLIPNMCVVKSRTECDTSVKLGQHTFKMPVVPANMASVINEEICELLAKQGFFYVMHRFNVDILAFVKDMKAKKLITSISIGVKQEDYVLVENLAKGNLIPDYITIDIAHGHSISVKNMIEHIRKNMKDKTFIIAGNVATKPIIADGGLRVNGDIAKSIRFGATMCMVGSLFAAHMESPGKNVDVDGVTFKEYYGSASEYNKGEKRYVEGKKELIQVRGKLLDTYKEMHEDLQSSVSYSGGNKLIDIKKVDYVILKTKAEEIIKTEMIAPYVPNDLMSFLSNSLLKIVMKKEEMGIDDVIVNQNMSPEKIFDTIKNSKSFDSRLGAAEQLIFLNTKMFQKEIEDFLSDPDACDVSKSIILDILIEQNNDNIVTVSKYGISRAIKPSDFKDLSLEDVAEIYVEKFEDKIAQRFKDQVISDITFSQLQFYCSNLYPFLFENNIKMDDIVVACLIHAHNNLGLSLDYDELMMDIDFNKENVEDIRTNLIQFEEKYG